MTNRNSQAPRKVSPILLRKYFMPTHWKVADKVEIVTYNRRFTKSPPYQQETSKINSNDDSNILKGQNHYQYEFLICLATSWGRSKGNCLFPYSFSLLLSPFLMMELLLPVLCSLSRISYFPTPLMLRLCDFL